MKINKTLILIISFFLCFSLAADTRKLTKRRTAMVQVELKADPGTYSGSFPVNVSFKGKIKSAKPGIVKYRFEFGDGFVGIWQSLTFKTPGEQLVVFNKMFKAPDTGRGRIWIISPANIYSNWATYKLKLKLITVSLKSKFKPKVNQKHVFTIKKIAGWKQILKLKMPDLIIQRFKTVGPAGYLNEVTRFEADVANIGNFKSGKCELAITMYVPKDIPKTEDNCPGCKFTYMYDIPELDPGTICTIKASWIFKSGPGLWKFVAKADSVRLKFKGVVPEINEDNNKATTFVVMHY